MHHLVGRRLPCLADALPQVFPGTAHETGKDLACRLGGLGEQRRLVRRRDERLEQRRVPIRAHRLEQALMDLLVGLFQRGHDHGTTGSLRRGELRSEPADPLEHHVGVAGAAEHVGQPPEALADGLGPGRIHERPERPQIRPQTPRGHAGLVDAFRIRVEADEDVVPDQSLDRGRDRPMDHVARGRPRSELG